MLEMQIPLRNKKLNLSTTNSFNAWHNKKDGKQNP